MTTNKKSQESNGLFFDKQLQELLPCWVRNKINISYTKYDETSGVKDYMKLCFTFKNKELLKYYYKQKNLLSGNEELVNVSLLEERNSLIRERYVCSVPTYIFNNTTNKYGEFIGEVAYSLIEKLSMFDRCYIE